MKFNNYFFLILSIIFNLNAMSNHFSLADWYKKNSASRSKSADSSSPSLDMIAIKRPNPETANFFSIQINDISGLESIDNPEKVALLNLSYNQISTIPTNSFNKFTAVEELDLQNNQIANFDFNTLAPLKNVTQVLFNENKLTSINKLPALPKLTNLALSNNQISTIAPDAFANIPNVRFIMLINNKLTSFDPALIKDLKNLRTLNLQGNQISEQTINNLKQARPDVTIVK